MSIGEGPRPIPAPPDRTERDLELDLRVGLRIEDYAWVEWNHSLKPPNEPGRFIGHPGDLVAHLYVEAWPDAPLAARPYAGLPRYSLEPGPALRAAERAGLFRGDGVVIVCSAGGTWRLSAERWRIEAEDECLPRLLSLAALRVVARDRDEGER